MLAGVQGHRICQKGRLSERKEGRKKPYCRTSVAVCTSRSLVQYCDIVSCVRLRRALGGVFWIICIWRRSINEAVRTLTRMGNHASKQGEKEREGGGTPSSPAVHHSSSSSAHSRKDPRIGSVRRHHHTSTDTSASVSPTSEISQRLGPSFSSTATSQQPSLDERMGNQHSKPKDEKDKTPKAKAAPVKVPRGSDPKRQRGPDTQFESSGPPRDPSFIPHSNLNFPPRLPLPIEEELYTPGSPILTGHGDVTSALHQDDVEGPLPRQSSAISNTTIEDDEVGNDLLLDQQERVEGYVPTNVYWKQGGEKVYVTGTFAQWSTKIRMHKE